MRSFFRSVMPRFLTDDGIIEEEEKNKKEDEPIQNQKQAKTDSNKHENFFNSQTKPPIKTDQNNCLMNPNQFFLDDLIKKGNLGIELFNQQKYQQSKEILVPCVENLLKLYQSSQNNAVKEYLVKFLKYSEECQKHLVFYWLFSLE